MKMKKITTRFAAVGAVWCIATAGTLQATILTAIPRQGGMLMPEVYYHADTDSVTVDLSAIGIIAQLTPLLVSNPQDRFDPADPWFEYLDPCRQGLAFSRRYGFDIAAMSDLLLANRALWIRKLSSSDGLSFYDYNDFVTPKTWAPVFATAGTSNAVHWSGLMWHFGVTAPPGANSYSAAFEIYVLDTITGLEVADSSTGPFALEWTDVPDGRPELTIARTGVNQVTVSWPAATANWTLITSETLLATNWRVCTNTPVTLDGQSAVTLRPDGASQFFRLQLNQ